MPIVTAEVIKPTPESKLGISFVQDTPGVIVLTKIAETSLFANTPLRVGQQILSVNDVSVDVTTTVPSVLAILQSSPKRVVLTAAPPSSLGKLLYSENKIRVPDGSAGGFSIQTQLVLNSDRNTVPPGLASMGVTSKKWARIVDAYSNDFLTAMNAANRMDTIFRKEMDHYVGAQMVRGSFGFGTESAHERKVFHMCHQQAVLSNNCNLVATNLLAKTNALLNAPHGVLVQLLFKGTDLRKISAKPQPDQALQPIGLEFLPVEE
jgi:hypothetical protein